MVGPNRNPNGEWASKLYKVRLDPVTKAFRSEPVLISEFNSRVSDITSAAKADVLIAIVQQAYPRVFVEDLDWPGPVVGPVQVLSSDDASAYPHSWTRDGKSVLYESNVTGRTRFIRRDLTSTMRSLYLQVYSHNRVRGARMTVHGFSMRTMRRRSIECGRASVERRKCPRDPIRLIFDAPSGLRSA